MLALAVRAFVRELFKLNFPPVSASRFLVTDSRMRTPYALRPIRSQRLLKQTAQANTFLSPTSRIGSKDARQARRTKVYLTQDSHSVAIAPLHEPVFPVAHRTLTALAAGYHQWAM
jgi:hypothetical protein